MRRVTIPLFGLPTHSAKRKWAGFLACLCSIIFWSSCEKVIQLDLSSTTPQLVIEGVVNDQPGPYMVKLSRTVDFNASSNYPPVSGAKLILTDNYNQNEELTETSAGLYKTSRFRGIPGRNYTLTVQSEGLTYTATSNMPYPVAMDSIYFSVNPFSGERMTTVRFTDPPYTVNYYKFLYFINGSQQKNYFTMSDELYQGNIVKYSFMSRNTEIVLNKGDQVTIWLESVDKKIYEYFRSSGNSDGDAANPANPVSNISGGALGYFNACSVTKISGTVK
ncbi:MAG: DUF4249 domain-containing protein [Marinilabiliales bacterium]|nr:DUF4249 domain-containing protein [Marinilabiliales bacterium]